MNNCPKLYLFQYSTVFKKKLEEHSYPGKITLCKTSLDNFTYGKITMALHFSRDGKSQWQEWRHGANFSQLC